MSCACGNVEIKGGGKHQEGWRASARRFQIENPSVGPTAGKIPNKGESKFDTKPAQLPFRFPTTSLPDPDRAWLAIQAQIYQRLDRLYHSAILDLNELFLMTVELFPGARMSEYQFVREALDMVFPDDLRRAGCEICRYVLKLCDFDTLDAIAAERRAVLARPTPDSRPPDPLPPIPSRVQRRIAGTRGPRRFPPRPDPILPARSAP